MPLHGDGRNRESRSWSGILADLCRENKIITIRTVAGGHLTGTAEYRVHRPRRIGIRPPMNPPLDSFYSYETTVSSDDVYLIVNQTDYGLAYIPIQNIDYFTVLPELEVNNDRATQES